MKKEKEGKILNDARIIELKRMGKTGIAFTKKHAKIKLKLRKIISLNNFPPQKIIPIFF